MNAIELADELDEWDDGTDYGLHREAATMLRKLQAENEALKAEIVAIEKNTDYWADKSNWIRNNKPVAHVSTTGLNDIEWTDASHSLNYGDALYTHPVKELTDENFVLNESAEITKEQWKSLKVSKQPVKEEHFEDEPQAEELHEILQSHSEPLNYEITHPRWSKEKEMFASWEYPQKTYEDGIEECAKRAEAYAYMSPNFTALAEELRAILRKAKNK